MAPAVLTTSEKPYDTPVLILDKEGSLGIPLAEKIQETYLTLLVSAREPKLLKNLIHVPFKKKIPVIPDNSFSHMILFYHGEKELLEALPSFLKKAKETNGKLVIITDRFHYTPQLFRGVMNNYDNCQIFVYGDIFGKSILFSSPASALLSSAKMTGRIDLVDSGLTEIYPIADQDVIDGIIAVVFSDSPLLTLFLLAPKHGVTELSFARMLQKLYPLLQVDFIKGKRASLAPLPDGTPVFLSYPLERRLKELDLTHTPLAPSLTKKKKQRFSPRRRKDRKPLFLIFSLVFFFLSLSVLSSVGAALTGGFFLLQAKESFERGDISHASRHAGAATSLFRIADQSTRTLHAGFSLIGFPEELVGFQTTIRTGKALADTAKRGIEGYSALSRVLDGKSASPKEDFLAGIHQLKQAGEELQLLQAEGRIPSPYKEKVAALEKPLAMFLNTSETYPTLFGFEKKQTYLVLFQNNFELRPGGGFIGSYGLLEVEKGRVTSFEVFDVYDADGKLKEHFDPPFALRRYMGATHWYLRDSNYSPDFPTSAASAATFLKRETGEEVDGVFAIDVSFLGLLLEATGPITLPDYKETVTKDNVFLVTQTHVEKNFFPGSTQKKDFLGALSQQLEKRILQREVPFGKLIPAVMKGIEQKHVLVAFADPAMQKLFSVNNFSSSLEDHRPADDNTVQDFLSVNEANIGLNKGNFYLKRNIQHTVAIDGEGGVRDEVSITYTNTSDANSPFGGEYKAYVRLIVPQGAFLEEVMVDSVVQQIPPAVTDPKIYTRSSFTPPKGLEVEQSQEKDKAVFGMLVTVPVKSTKKLTVIYRLQNKIPVSKQQYLYDLVVMKQPGTLEDPYSLTVRYPISARVFSTSSPVSDVGGKLHYSTALSTDRALRITFVKR